MDPFSVDLCETDIRLDEDDFFQPFFRARTTTWPKAAFTVTVYSRESRAPSVNVSCVNRQQPAHEYKPQQAVNHQASSIHPIAKRHTHKSNPWGEATYAELISRAISASPEHRLKLPQIYEWIARNVPYFSEQDAQGSICWKNSIRHTLSLSSNPFVRIPDDHPGKSSWWAVEAKGDHMINPSGGLHTRRRANTACVNELQKMRQNAVRKVTETVAASKQSCETQTEPPETIDEVLGEFFPLCNNSAFDSDPYGKRFRCRTVSLTSAGLMRIDERMPDYGVADYTDEARGKLFEADRSSVLLAEPKTAASDCSSRYLVPPDGHWERQLDMSHNQYPIGNENDCTCQEYNSSDYGRLGPDVVNGQAWTQSATINYESLSSASSKSSSPQAQTVPQAYSGFDCSPFAAYSTSGSMAFPYISATSTADTGNAVNPHVNTSVLVDNAEVPQQTARCNIVRDISFTVITTAAAQTNQRDVTELPECFADGDVNSFDALSFSKEADCLASLQDLDFHFDRNGNICF